VKKQNWWEKGFGQESPQMPGTGHGELGLRSRNSKGKWADRTNLFPDERHRTNTSVIADA
jgi:hypothetical protein